MLTVNQKWHNPRLNTIWKVIVVLAKIQNSAEQAVETVESLNYAEKRNQQVAAKPNQKCALFHRGVNVA